MAADPRRVKELFVQALELPDEAARQALLEQGCGSDHDLRQRLEVLLQAHDDPASVLNRPLAGVLAVDLGATGPGSSLPPSQTDDAPSAEGAGTLLAGRYRLVEEIGAGGMGTVWLARQLEPVRRLVAVKLIKPGMDSRAVLASFEAERQALALMDHPNIARVLDAGAAPDGRPFFVMELVKGVPITRYCDEQHLKLRQRLELFVAICAAIQHAHHKGIIHRDIKPSNVLVTLCDDRPLVKVIDFGIAKATGQNLTEQTLHTGVGVLVGTPEYMSPEQAELNNQDIDTRSDVYSLGVLLYELLTGTTPFCSQELGPIGLLEMLRVIREQEPTRPSTRLSTADGLTARAGNRGTEPGKLPRLVRGELDWIVLKALEKDRSRRYETANGFALDVSRYLADEPVLACPPSTVYRLKKLNDAGIYYNLGVALAAQRKLYQAMTAYRKAIALRPGYAEAHCNLGAVLEQLGRFAQALEARRKGHELGHRQPGWRFPSGLWVKRCERLLALDRKLPDVLAGKTASAAEQASLAEFCLHYKKCYADAALFYGKAFAARSSLAEGLNRSHRYNAARGAVLAAGGKGAGADRLDAAARARLRGQARDWLAASLDVIGKFLADHPEDAGEVEKGLQHWLDNPDLSGVREAKELADLPDEERQRWMKLWSEVRDLVRRAGKK
jgi:serine/threonine protein kinase